MTTSVGGGKGDRGIHEAVSYAVGHRIRVEILTALHELGSASAIELSRIVHEPLSTVTHHIGELLKAGSIRVERTEKVRSVEQRFYCLLNPVYVSDEEWEAMSEERSWRRIDEIEAEAAARCARNGEEPFSVLVSGLSVERARTASGPPPRPAEYGHDHAPRDQGA